MLHPPEGGPKVPYTRVSTLAKALDDKSGLVNWKASMAVLGLMKSKALQARTASLLAGGGGYQLNKTPLREIVDSATDLAGSGDSALRGTSVHEFTDLLDAGTLDWTFVPDDLKGPLEAYAEATSHLTVLQTEVFVTVDAEVNGEPLRASGSMDRVFSVDGNPVVADLKTGANEPKYPLGVTTQVAIYSRGLRYRDSDFKGSPPFADGVANPDGSAWRKPLAENGVNQHMGLMVHLPLEKVRNKFRCDVYVLPLEHGWRAVEAAVSVREIKKLPKLEKL